LASYTYLILYQGANKVRYINPKHLL
jgi:hypothetical protein